MSDHDLKSFIKRRYASINYGQSTSTVKSINLSSNTTDKIAIGKYYTSQKQNRGNSPIKNVNNDSDHVIIIPSSVDVQMLGCPFIARGSAIFLDAGTNTDLDNIYIVNAVTHTITGGSFTTSLELLIAHQGAVRNVRRQLAKQISSLIDKSKGSY